MRVELAVTLSVLLTFAAEVTSQNSGDVRLIDGGAPNNGTLQVFFNNTWGYVCDDGFGQANSQVVCRQLGYYPPNPQIPICCQRAEPPLFWLDNVRCSGNEARIEFCRHNGWGNHNCGAQEGVKVQCVYIDPCDSNPCPDGQSCTRITNTQFSCQPTNGTARRTPNFSFRMGELMRTNDGQAISFQCVRGLRTNMETRAHQMVNILNSQLNAGICPGTTGFNIVGVGSLVAAVRERGYVAVEFFLGGLASSTYNQFYECSDRLYAFSREHSNWTQPILPAPSGCSAVTFDQPRFREIDRNWEC